jgi:hypothetical protein
MCNILPLTIGWSLEKYMMTMKCPQRHIAMRDMQYRWLEEDLQVGVLEGGIDYSSVHVMKSIGTACIAKLVVMTTRWVAHQPYVGSPSSQVECGDSCSPVLLDRPLIVYSKG